ncbi:ABC-2 type transporter-domain-containing protein, partial [Myxozyma melibiosi]
EFKSDGRWGETADGPGVDVQQALEEFDDLRRELSRVSRASHRSNLDLEKLPSHATDVGNDDADDDGQAFDLESWIRNDTAKDRDYVLPTNNSFRSHPQVGVSFKNLSVDGAGSGAAKVPTFLDSCIYAFGGGFVLSLLRTLIPPLQPAIQTRPILHDFSGLVRAGEMLLVLGPPGSGTTTLLRALTNQREGYVRVGGDVLYDGIEPQEAKDRYRGEIVFNDEDDRHFSTLTVAQTLRFALRLKTPSNRPSDESASAFVEKLRELYGKMFGIEHTMNTFVGGDSKARGVSGGERKRVSIAEVLANRAAIVAFDNSTRGLDASTAVDYIRSLRILTNVTHSTTIVTLYQAGEGIYKEFDKVCLVYSGHQIYFGPASEARAYFEDLGFVPAPRVTTADFLTSITRPAERRIRPGYENRVPKTPEDFENAYKASRFYQQTLTEIDLYHAELENTGHASAQAFTEAVKLQKSASSSPYTVSFFRQVQLLIIRELQLQWQDQVLLKTKIINSIACGFIFGSLFFNIPEDTSGAFNRGGIIFFSLVFNGWCLQVESGNIIDQRPLLNKHRSFGMFRPAALGLAKTFSDLPILSVQILLYVIITYFLSNLNRTAGQFFTHAFIVMISTFNLMAFYRCIAAFSDNIDGCLRLVAAVLNALAFWTGYVLPSFKMPWWYRWFYYVNPLTYSFEALIANEFHGREMLCVDAQLVPSISGVGLANQACTLPGSVPGEAYVSGDSYIETQFAYKHSHLWRDVGITFGFLVFFLIVNMIVSEFLTYNSGSGQIKQFAKLPVDSADSTQTAPSSLNEEKISENDQLNNDESDEESDEQNVEGSLFTFREVSFTVPTPDGEKQLLNNVEGYAVPGKLLALMGSSGAGKTTLLNTISQRMRVGHVTGDFLLNGYPLSKSFQRTTGFVEQQDLHEAKQTIREALRFSARLRQPRTVSLKEKYDFVESVIDLLDLGSIADAIIDSVGSGLSVEERKRVTIGVELAAKPDLLFLDEPTSGLDSEGAYAIVSFLKKLAKKTHLGIICTIHQPSAILFSQFDNLLLLARGGKTVYFGPIGRGGETVIEYFSTYSKPPASDANPAEYILEVTGAGAGRRSKIDWPQVWLNSPEITVRRQEIADYINRWQSQRRPQIEGASDVEELEFAAPLSEQIKAVTIRLELTLWRTPSLGISFVFASLSAGLTAGILFFQLDNSILGMQSRTFSMFFTLLQIIPILNSLEIHFIDARDLFDLRERNSKVYSWVALVTAYLVCPIPYVLLSSVLFFPTIWYMPGLSMSAYSAGFGYFCILLMNLWHASSAIMLGAFVPSTDAAGVINPLFFVITQAIVGITIPLASMNGFYSKFLYWANPVAYVIRALCVTAEHKVSVSCDESELAIFDPPSGQTCSQFAQSWVESSSRGILLNPDANAGCEFCQYTVGDDYLDSLGWSFGTRWRDIGLYIMFTGVSYLVPFLVYYVARVMSWKGITRPFKKLVGGFMKK